MSKYRFKTKEEFIRDGLWDDKYNCPDGWAYGGHMNMYLGTNVPEEFNTDCDKNTGFKYNDWVFSEDDYVLKEQQEYFDDLSQHIGRYIRALVDNPHLGSEVKKGDIGKIISYGKADFPNRKSYSCTLALSENYLGVKYELLPEDYSPEQEIKESNVKFIPGKWYKLIDCENAYRKCSKIPVENRLPYSELIENGGYRCEIGSSKNLTRIKLVEDLSEIQEYLPDGHPDKIGSFNFEVGKWYNFTTRKGKYSIYAKVSKVTDRNLFFMNGESISNGYFGKATCIELKLIENPRLVEDLSEIQKYLPNEHPDKITSNKFKKGEYIVLIGDGQSMTDSSTVQTDAYIQNHCYKVKEADTFLMTELDSNGITTNGWQCIPYNPNEFHKTRNWRYATQEEIDEYERRGKPYDVTELNKQSFPEEGHTVVTDNPENLINYLEYHNRKCTHKSGKYNKNTTILAWNKSSYWFCEVGSSKMQYNKHFIEEIIGQPIYSDSQLSMKEIQEECKSRFPIGCTFISVGSCMHRILKEDSYTYSIVGKQIWAHYGEGYLYENGKWAELVSSPKQNDLKEEVIKYSEETNATILLASNIKSKELHSTYGNTSLSAKLLSNKTTPIINNVRVISSVNLKIK